MKIVFLGTPDFAVPSLDAICRAGYQVVAVVTAPDKESGRGMNLRQSPVKKYALQHGLKVLQPVRLKDENFLAELNTLQADLQVVIAFRMLPQAVWNMPPLGTLNLHASLLPDYRGAAPINRAIMNGETKTGVCTFFLKHEIDTGDILLKDEVEITGSMTAGELHDLLMQRGAQLVVQSLKLVEQGKYQTTPQEKTSAKTAPKIFKEDCKIDWNKSCAEIYNQVRGLCPYPAAFTVLQDKILKIYHCEPEPATHSLLAGQLLSDNKTYLKFACRDGFIHVKEVQPESKKRMDVAAFLRGHGVTNT